MIDDASKSMTLIDHASGKSLELPVLNGTQGPPVIDIRQLYAETGHFTFDPGYTATGSCTSRITFVDGEKGVLLHRGYRIEDLAQKSDFLEVAYLLLSGELPNQEQRNDFDNEVSSHTMLHDQLIRFYSGFRRDAHPMAVMVGVVGAL